MISRVLLFPHSEYLAQHWWHRLAKTIFWGWFIFALGFCWKVLVADPYMSCIRTKIQSEVLLNKPSDLECGRNAVDYLIANASTSSTSEIVFGSLFFVAVLYLALASPGLLYRLLLYIAKGSEWKDARPA
ncbi:hypothetical protein SAMN05216317_1195 [Nitrosomonas eutropha]|uniref:hypothetical protein n=1 Tax=Nitrosomonas sp. GH22 TaxID=153947 RepID=UPI0008974662|nr:hypothetical protein [Nitrosomonas sp. GH22]MXS81136.1 hypothetical protein [Nitrosomonas sp. GH22]SDW93069.1 hypothetical protein SAMN05216317_1195 [Nitrosomonas eutropha]